MNDDGGTRRPAPQPPPMSPCIHVCVMDEHRRFCTGCRRTGDEIARWWGMSDAEKRAVLASLCGRPVSRCH